MPTQRWSRGLLAATAATAATSVAYLCAAWPCVAVAGASDQAADALEEIVVTATRREESISKVPISITAYTQDAMDLKGIKDFQDVARFTPGVQIDADQTNQISIRGISSSGGAGTTGIYIDDTPIQMRALGFNPDEALPKTFDLDRVEVLRGPQGTLFGAGAEGGAVRYITPQPSLHEFSAYARTELASTQGGAPSYEAGYAAGGPIIDGTFGARASVWYRRDGGWIDRIDPTTLDTVDRNANHDDTVAAKFAVSWAPTGSATITPSIYFQNRERNDVSIYWPIYSDPGADRYKSANPTGLQEPDQFILPVVKVNVDLGPMEFISNTSAYHRRDLSGYDGTLLNLSYYQTLGGANAYPFLPYLNPSEYPLLDQNGIHLPPGLQNYRAPAQVTNKQDNLTQELRLQSKDNSASVTWTVGAFWMIGRTYSLEAINDPMANHLFETLFGIDICTAFQVAAPDCLPNNNSYENQLIGHDRQVAVFGEVNWSVTEKLKLTGGARYSRTQFSFSSFSDGAQNGGPAYGSGAEKANPFTPKLGLDYQFDPSTMAYLTWAKGFRIGGANAPVDPSLCQFDFQNFGIKATPLSYAPDTVKSWELGMKSNIDNRVKLATSVFYITWNGIQQTITLPTCGLSYTANVGTAVAKGFDFQADIGLTEHLVLESAVGYTNARYTANATPAPGSPVILAAKGDAIVGEAAIPDAPWTVALGFQYGFDVAAHASFARVDYEFQSRNEWKTPSEDPQTALYSYTQQPGGPLVPTNYNPPSQSFVSLRAGSKFGKWNIAAFVDNLLDSHTTTNYNFTGLDPSNPALLPLYRNFSYRPRTIGVTGTYRY